MSAKQFKEGSGTMPASKANQRAVAKYMKSNYDDIKIRVKKGSREQITEIAKNNDESLNGYIKRAVKKQIKDETGNEIEL